MSERTWVGLVGICFVLATGCSGRASDAQAPADASVESLAPPPVSRTTPSGGLERDPSRPSALLARLPGVGIRARFEKGALAIGLDSSGETWPFGLRLAAAGRTGAMRPMAEATATRVEGLRVRYDRGAGLEEWFEQRAAGIEHGFEVARAPEGTGALRFELAIEGTLHAVDRGGEVELVDANGSPQLRYGQLSARDATGRALGARMHLEGTKLAIEVDATGAQYPISIDPLVWAMRQAIFNAVDATNGDSFGSILALNADTALIGGPTAGAGSAYVFKRTGIAWAQQQKLTPASPTGTEQMGTGVSISGDTAAVAGSVSQGAVWIFVRNPATGVWTQQQKLVASDPTIYDNFGSSVALDGDTLLVGAPSKDGVVLDCGAAYVFTRSGTTWTQRAKLLAAGATADEHFGNRVALNGGTAAIGAPLRANGAVSLAGIVIVYTGSGAVWTQQQQIPSPAPIGGESFGSRLSLSGNTLLVGGLSTTVRFFQRSGTTWSLNYSKTLDNGPGGVSIDGDNAVLSSTTSVTGSAVVLQRTAGVWAEAITVTNGTGIADYFGQNAAISGTTFIVGAIAKRVANGATNAGAVHVFTQGKTQGDPCAVSTDCLSGYCVDGVCCNAPCGSSCQACSALKKGSGSDGTCAAIKDGTDPDAECPGSTCSGGITEIGHVCNGASACRPTTTSACTPYVCNAGATGCLAVCTTDVDCVAGDWCKAGACVPKGATGASCVGGNECTSTFCVDGVCCGDACTSKCQACSAAKKGQGADGACGNIASGNDPDGECPGVSCTAGTFNDNVCDGTGGCFTKGTSCAPFTCDALGQYCSKTCTMDVDCGAGAYCTTAHVCSPKKGQAASCVAANECLSGACVDGVCCGAACTGSCQACTAAKKGSGVDGVCGTIANGTDPDKECPGVTCAGTTRELAHACNGAGACVATSTAPCAPYTCATGTTCGTSCTSDASCDANDWCSANKCVAKKDDGTSCVAGNECKHGSCVDGVCCDSPCAGKCQACIAAKKGGGVDGTCGNIGNGLDPDEDCPGSSCTAGTFGDNVCDGNGGCYVKSTSCAPFTCDPSAKFCLKTCAVDLDCGAGSYCTAAKQCTPQKAGGQACGATHECLSGNCVDGVCCNSACAGACVACSAAKKGAGADGVCSAIVDGLDPDLDCPGATCAGVNRELGHVCDGKGGCRATTTASCGAYACDAAGLMCRTACGVDAECAVTSWCSGGSCTTKKDTGSACAGANECKSANCVDGVCCDTACAGKCQACIAAKKGSGADGVCGPIAADTDPDADCPGSSCASATFNDNVCDGASGCRTKSSSCAPFNCDASGTICLKTCATDADCGSDGFCDATKQCQPRKAKGSTCAADPECKAGAFCVDGVCCESKCDGQCQACDVVGSLGSCVAVTGKPHAARTACAGDGTVCAGTCDGKQGLLCAFPETTTSCGAGCAGGSVQACDGKGACGPATPCPGNFGCVSATKCATVCATDGDCGAGYACDNLTGKCLPPKATCSPDQLSSQPPGGAGPKACGIYRCNPSTGDCFDKCSSTDQCSPGNACESGVCTPVAAAATQDSGGCSVSTPGLARGGAALGVALAIAALRRRRRR